MLPDRREWRGSQARKGSSCRITTGPEGPRLAAGPSYPGTVVLELGPGAGALVLHAPAILDGAEIEISPAGNTGFRTHAMVRPRHVAGGTAHAAVYPDLPPGRYVIWTSHDSPGPAVTVAAGSVTTARWPD